MIQDKVIFKTIHVCLGPSLLEFWVKAGNYGENI